ncbi:hypothetical protein TVAG_144310 [Trichomonas vaginalis G3]|uniref:Uncharacterized protein n=1 Tax=Trichomonas vaginalis (strain ATCC PRA-98 / G3) TaxID=412133 RepID=A2FHC4_TRIV3|nr:hypothetical protein TVAG_250900 [Trichomonas vaginalis G3]EAX95682.1 hypothetical protein TVAG_144310 [Trichomonas vaginalis G3]|eukprot:XP_001307854.1 hypothetical protein [Trichomonas vaginalis G3]
MQKIQEEEKNLQDLMTNKYIVAINQIKQRFQNDFPPVQDDPEIVALKEQFTTEQNNLHSIKTPGTGNGEFALLNATVETLQNELNGQKLSIDKERETILNSWKKQIEDEERRHQNIGEGPSTRGRDQLKHTLQSQIDGVIESRENDEKKLRDILNLLNSESERVSKLYQTELENPLHQTQVDSLKNELENVDEILENMIKTANNNKTQEIQEMKDSISKLNVDISTKIEKLNQEIKSENENSVNLLEKAKNDLEDIIEKSKHDDKTTSLELSQNLEKIHIKNDNEIDSTRIKIKQLKSKIANDKNTNEIIISSTKSQNEKDLEKAEKNFQKEVHKLQCNLTGLSDFLDEKIQVLEEEVQKLNANFDITKPRECDVEKIEMLEKKLVNTTAFLKSQLQEFMQIKSLIVSRENEYNKRFGSGPKVGTYSMQQPHSAHSQRGFVN